MRVVHYTSVPAEEMSGPDLHGVRMRVVIGPEHGAPNFVMRVFELGPGGYTPWHSHDWEHEVFIKQGQGVLKGEGEERPLAAGDVVFIPGQEMHQFRNTGQGPLEFICLIPRTEG